SIDYLAVGLPFKKIAFTFGVMPFSSVGYRVANTSNVNNLERFRQFEGSGGVDRVFLASGYQLNNNFRIGLEANFNFGTVETVNREFVADLETGTRETNTSRLNGSSFTVGLMYERPLNEKLTSFASFAYTPETVMRSTNRRNLANLLNSPVLGNLVVDEIDLPVENTRITLPSKLNFGLGIGGKNKWLLGAEITHQQSSSFGNRFNDIDRVDFENATRIVLGGYFVPKYNSFTSYFSRVVYRAGLRFENTGLVMQ
ncbi:hypothetical protein RZS08_09225, partial [Arthrospira platensis SPKY1]|nr:hypothetical protein [Arthrospira platensis SPKY1]